MKFKTLIAVAVAGAFAVPFAAQAQGTGGTTTAPSATHPQGNPPAKAAAGSQTSGAGSTSGAASWDKLDKNKDGYLSRDELKDNALADRFSELDKDNDGRISRAEFDAHSSGAGATGSSSGTAGSGAGNMGSGSSGTSAGTPKSPSSGGPASTQGGSSNSTTGKEPK